MIVAPPIDREPRCGRCGYIVRGIPSFICPECGSDLREVGIRVGRERSASWASMGFLALIWAVVLWIGAAAIVTGLEQLPPHWVSLNWSSQYQSPESKAYLLVSMQAAGVCRADRPAPMPALPQYTLVLVANDGSKSQLALDFAANTYSIAGGPAVPAGGPVGPQAIAAWMKGAGIDTTSKQVQAEIASMFGAIQALPRHMSSRGSWSSSSSGSRAGFGNFFENSSGRSIERVWPTLIVAVLALGAWLLGVRWMARRFGPQG